MKKQITFRIDADVIERTKDIVYANRHMSLNSLVEYALTQIVAECGAGVPPRADELKPGRKLQ